MSRSRQSQGHPCVRARRTRTPQARQRAGVRAAWGYKGGGRHALARMLHGELHGGSWANSSDNFGVGARRPAISADVDLVARKEARHGCGHSVFACTVRVSAEKSGRIGRRGGLVADVAPLPVELVEQLQEQVIVPL